MTEERKLSVPSWFRSRISRRNFGRGNNGFDGLLFFTSGVCEDPVVGGGGIVVGVGCIRVEVGSVKIWGARGVVPGASAMMNRIALVELWERGLLQRDLRN